MIQEFKSIEEIKEEVAKEHISSGEIATIEQLMTKVAKRHSQQYIDANKELVEMLEELTKVATINRFFEVKHKAIALLNKQS